jgi:hypothetical protein
MSSPMYAVVILWLLQGSDTVVVSNIKFYDSVAKCEQAAEEVKNHSANTPFRYIGHCVHPKYMMTETGYHLFGMEP